MKKKVNIDEFYFSLYAMRRRMGLGKHGYPTESPFYTPPRLGETAEGEREHVTDEDIWIADHIEIIVNRHKRKSPTEAFCFEVWEGAYIDAPPDRKDRLKEWRLPYGPTRKAAFRCRKHIEREMYPND